MGDSVTFDYSTETNNFSLFGNTSMTGNETNNVLLRKNQSRTEILKNIEMYRRSSHKIKLKKCLVNMVHAKTIPFFYLIDFLKKQDEPHLYQKLVLTNNYSEFHDSEMNKILSELENNSIKKIDTFNENHNFSDELLLNIQCYIKEKVFEKKEFKAISEIDIEGGYRVDNYTDINGEYYIPNDDIRDIYNKNVYDKNEKITYKLQDTTNTEMLDLFLDSYLFQEYQEVRDDWYVYSKYAKEVTLTIFGQDVYSIRKHIGSNPNSSNLTKGKITEINKYINKKYQAIPIKNNDGSFYWNIGSEGDNVFSFNIPQKFKIKDITNNKNYQDISIDELIKIKNLMDFCLGKDVADEFLSSEEVFIPSNIFKNTQTINNNQNISISLDSVIIYCYKVVYRYISTLYDLLNNKSAIYEEHDETKTFVLPLNNNLINNNEIIFSDSYINLNNVFNNSKYIRNLINTINITSYSENFSDNYLPLIKLVTPVQFWTNTRETSWIQEVSYPLQYDIEEAGIKDVSLLQSNIKYEGFVFPSSFKKNIYTEETFLNESDGNYYEETRSYKSEINNPNVFNTYSSYMVKYPTKVTVEFDVALCIPAYTYTGKEFTGNKYEDVTKIYDNTRLSSYGYGSFLYKIDGLEEVSNFKCSLGDIRGTVKLNTLPTKKFKVKNKDSKQVEFECEYFTISFETNYNYNDDNISENKNIQIYIDTERLVVSNSDKKTISDRFEFWLQIYQLGIPKYRQKEKGFIEPLWRQIYQYDEEAINKRIKTEKELYKKMMYLGIDLNYLAFKYYYDNQYDNSFSSVYTKNATTYCIGVIPKIKSSKLPFIDIKGYDLLETVDKYAQLPNGFHMAANKNNPPRLQYCDLRFFVVMYHGSMIKNKNTNTEYTRKNSEMLDGEKWYLFTFLSKLLKEQLGKKHLENGDKNYKKIDINYSVDTSKAFNRFLYERWFSIESIEYEEKSYAEFNNNRTSFEHNSTYTRGRQNYIFVDVDGNDDRKYFTIVERKSKIRLLKVVLTNFRCLNYILVWGKEVNDKKATEYIDEHPGWNMWLDHPDLKSEYADNGIMFPLDIDIFREAPLHYRLDLYYRTTYFHLVNGNFGFAKKRGIGYQIGMAILGIILIIVGIVITVVTYGAGSPAGIYAIVTGVLAITMTLTTVILLACGVIDEKTYNILQLASSIIGIASSIGSFGIQTATTIPELALRVSSIVMDIIAFGCSIACEVIQYELEQNLKKIENQRKNLLELYNERQEEYTETQEYIHETKSTNLDVNDMLIVMGIKRANDGLCLTPSQFYKATKTIGFDYSVLYDTPYNTIENFVDNCLNLW